VRPAAAIALAALLSACAVRPAAPTPVSGYLASTEITALAGDAPPHPLAPSDHAASQALRSLEDSDRWRLATAQAELRPPEAAQHFDCALGVRFAQHPRPALTRLMGRLLADSTTLTERLARVTARPRPAALDPDRRACVRLTDETRASSAWPVGPAVAGAAYAELFAALAPDRAEAVYRTGHEIGVSRAVCAMAWPADVAPSKALGRTVYARAALTRDFTADLSAARAEVQAARAERLTSPACAAERLALGQSPF